MNKLLGWQCQNPKCKKFFKGAILYNGNGKPMRHASICPVCKKLKMLKMVLEEVPLNQMPTPYIIQDESIIQRENNESLNALCSLKEFSLLVVS